MTVCVHFIYSESLSVPVYINFYVRNFVHTSGAFINEFLKVKIYGTEYPHAASEVPNQQLHVHSGIMEALGNRC